MRLFIDFDNTIVQTIRRVCDLYNEDYAFYDSFIPVCPDEITSWNFKELVLANKKNIDLYFTQSRFFNEELVEMRDACDVINRLYDNGDTIFIVSTGTRPNLRLKKAWLRNHIRFTDFLEVDINKYKNKNHIDMKGGILIDDMTLNLNGSNAMKKICFGDKFRWNADWNGERCLTWNDVYKTLTEDMFYDER